MKELWYFAVKILIILKEIVRLIQSVVLSKSINTVHILSAITSQFQKSQKFLCQKKLASGYSLLIDFLIDNTRFFVFSVPIPFLSLWTSIPNRI